VARSTAPRPPVFSAADCGGSESGPTARPDPRGWESDRRSGARRARSRREKAQQFRGGPILRTDSRLAWAGRRSTGIKDPGERRVRTRLPPPPTSLRLRGWSTRGASQREDPRRVVGVWAGASKGGDSAPRHFRSNGSYQPPGSGRCRRIARWPDGRNAMLRSGGMPRDAGAGRSPARSTPSRRRLTACTGQATRIRSRKGATSFST
jgi:hypothetical protein